MPPWDNLVLLKRCGGISGVVDILRWWLVAVEVVGVVQVMLIAGMVVVLVQHIRMEAADVQEIRRTGGT